MLKVYHVYNYYQLNGGYWKRGALSGAELLDNPPQEKLVFYDLSWQDLRKCLMTTHISGMHNDTKGFKRIPYIAMYDWETDQYYRYFEGDFESVAFKKVYKEWNDVPLDFIIRRFPADQAIQYLRERGLGLTTQN